LNGLPTVLWDTAGIRDTDDEIEQLGVKFTREHIDKSDAVIVVLDGSVALTAEDQRIFDLIPQAKALFVVNKSDLPQALSEAELARFTCSQKIWRVSAKTGEGIPALKAMLRDLVIESERESPVVITNVRHRSALQKSQEALTHAVQSLKDGYATEFVAIDLNEAREALEEITGGVNTEDILDKIFSSFCIGK
jgi:tRNA modification GTPase